MNSLHHLTKLTLVLCYGEILFCHAATIKGLVVDGNGHRVRGAHVAIVDPFVAGRSLRGETIADSDGRFEVDGLSRGEYQVFASQPEEGYGDPQFAFFAVGMPSPPEVKLRESKETVEVTVGVGLPGGFLKLLIEDSTTGAPLNKARIRLVMQQQPDIFVSMAVNSQGALETPVPSSPITAIVTAPGFQPTEIDIGKLASGEHRIVTVKIRPVSQ